MSTPKLLITLSLALLATSLLLAAAKTPTTKPAASKPPTTKPAPAAALSPQSSVLSTPSPRPSAQPKDLTDAQVLTAISKGVDFLLAQKHNNNFETRFDADGNPAHAPTKPGAKPPADNKWTGGNFGGETALILYALLHVGQSLDDPRLRYKSDELAPVIAWLADVSPDATYTAGLQASALALVPRQPNIDVAFRRIKDYLLSAMGPDGGYDYTSPNATAAVRADRLSHQLQTLMQKIADTPKNDPGLGALKDQAKKLEADMKAAQIESHKPRHIPNLQERGRQVNQAKTAVANAQKKLDDPATANDPDALAKATKSLHDAQNNLAEATFNVNNFYFTGDLSNGQYGTLGAWALEETQLEIPNDYWQTSDRFWRGTQRPDGGWTYNVKVSPTAHPSDSMTAAGLASLFIVQEFTDTALRLDPKPDRNIDNGLAWITANFNPKNSSAYFLYGIERVGLASGLKFFGQTNWYKSATLELLKRQKPDGSWAGGFYGADPNIATSYSLLFLARGRNPVVFNKLQYDGPWNARPRDNANLTAWMSKNTERPLNWQIVNLQVDPSEWLDAPILLITGSRNPNFSDADILKLRAFITAGGIIFSSADGGKDDFSDAIQKIALKVLGPSLPFRTLPPDHYLFSSSLWHNIENPPTILGISNGVRELWIHSPSDMAASWQQHKFASAPTDFTFPANLYFYAAGRGSLRSKLQPLAVTPNKEKTVRSLSLARLKYAGNWDPEPGAWPRMAKLAQADAHTNLQLSTLTLPELDPKKIPLAHLTGVTQFPRGVPEANALRDYLNNGGFLLVDAAGGNPAFTDSFLQALKEIFPDASPSPLPPDHPIYTGNFPDGTDATKATYRRFTFLTGGKTNSPRLLGLTLNHRLALVYSPDDLTSGLLGTNTWGIRGYTPDYAQTLTQNILLYAHAQ